MAFHGHATIARPAAGTLKSRLHYATSALRAASSIVGLAAPGCDVRPRTPPARQTTRFREDAREIIRRAVGATRERPVVFVGPYEHHANELPWRVSFADVVTIPEDANGHIDLAHLERELVAYADRPLRIGSCWAASNVTGIRRLLPQ